MVNKNAKQATKAEPAKEAPKPTKVTVIKILKADAKYRGAREAWYAELKAHDGKPVKEFLDHVTAKPPSTPKKGKLEGKLEPPTGWLSYFKREGVVAYPDQEVKAS
jgi:hypothetical protein